MSGPVYAFRFRSADEPAAIRAAAARAGLSTNEWARRALLTAAGVDVPADPPAAEEGRKLRQGQPNATSGAQPTLSQIHTERAAIKRATKRMGSEQRAALLSLARHERGWHRSCGWIWTNRSTTERLLSGLVKRGLAQVTRRQVRAARDGVPAQYTTTWTITELGRAVVGGGK